MQVPRHPDKLCQGHVHRRCPTSLLTGALTGPSGPTVAPVLEQGGAWGPRGPSTRFLRVTGGPGGQGRGKGGGRPGCGQPVEGHKHLTPVQLSPRKTAKQLPGLLASSEPLRSRSGLPGALSLPVPPGHRVPGPTSQVCASPVTGVWDPHAPYCPKETLSSPVRKHGPAQLPSAGWLGALHTDLTLSCTHSFIHSFTPSHPVHPERPSCARHCPRP